MMTLLDGFGWKERGVFRDLYKGRALSFHEILLRRRETLDVPLDLLDKVLKFLCRPVTATSYKDGGQHAFLGLQACCPVTVAKCYSLGE